MNNVCKNTSERINGLKFIVERYRKDGNKETDLNHCQITFIEAAIEDLERFKQYKAGIRSLRKEYINKSNQYELLPVAKSLYLSFVKELFAFEDIK